MDRLFAGGHITWKCPFRKKRGHNEQILTAFVLWCLGLFSVRDIDIIMSWVIECCADA